MYRSIGLRRWLSISFCCYLQVLECLSPQQVRQPSLSSGLTSVAYLPSTFAMYGVTLAHAFSFKHPSKVRTIQMFTTIGITSIFSWPFAAITAFVLFAQDVVQMEWTKSQFREFIKALTVAGAYVASFLVISLFAVLTLGSYDCS
jgi:hypothetical protein